MAKLHILSAGAAQAVVEQVIPVFERETGSEVVADFSAVGAMKSRFLTGEAADIIILTRALIDELVASGHVDRESVHDLGKVGTGAAVRAGAPLPEVSDREALRANILAASAIACPDPAAATAGKIVMRMLQQMGVAEEVRERIRLFPNGYAAMRWLAASKGALDIGMTQVTEIRANPGVTYVGPLPDVFQMKATYTVAQAAHAAEAALAGDFIGRLAAPGFRGQLVAAGYELD